MGVLTIDQRVLADAACVRPLDATQLEDLCMMLQLHVQSTASSSSSEKKVRRRLSRHASVVGLPTEAMDRAVSGLSSILIDAAKKDLSPHDLVLSVLDLHLSPDQLDVLTQYYTDHKDGIKAAAAWHVSMGVPSYRSIDWRLDMEIGTRTRHHAADPRLTVWLAIDGTPSVDTPPLQCDFATLASMHQTLREALKAAQTPHGSRMQRYL
ncbi:Aste57867_13578 [Aphanomyces stellatus]|uniref:Aste57867_13578 protein n=1 Tax=Aphanomyces stellatus TaxID=120398 RepID=A0A485L076_9STRA|nr:hypothetical protein As57867_013528 [Aphanomyces stellatus]VFT90416.1 Aste57867_13578 [Aphanomyces stellatus]